MKKIWLTALGAGLLAASLVGCGSQEPSETAAEERPPVPVRVAETKLVGRQEAIPAAGAVEARDSVTVSSKVLGYIVALHAREGDRVRKGELLVEIDDRELSSSVDAARALQAEAESAIQAAEHAIAAAEAQQRLAETTHRRFAELREKDSLTEQEFDEATARLEQARANVAAAKSQKSQAESKRAQAAAQLASAEVTAGHAKIHSPVDGVVVERFDDTGNLAAPGQPLLEIERSGGWLLTVAVPESQVGSLATGRTISLEIPALGESGPRQGRVAEIVPAVDPASRTFLVKVALPANPALRSGLYGRVFTPGPEAEIVQVPLRAVVERGQLQSVFVVEDGRAYRRLVKLGAPAEDRYPVLSGLEAGEQVVLDPGGLADGSPVRISGREEL